MQKTGCYQRAGNIDVASQRYANRQRLIDVENMALQMETSIGEVDVEKEQERGDFGC